jgi:hypothetical protein
VTADSSTAVPASPDAPKASPAPSIRYRCAACGNLTRFSVVTNRRTRAFHHFSVGGELSLEDVEVLDETVEEVSCRWCGNGNAIETVETVEGGTPNPE